jgi:hypothetical protein
MKNQIKINVFVFAICLAILPSGRMFAGANANLNQARNGTDPSPTSPVNWVNGNLGSSQAHYIEGMSSPYQCVMTGMTVGVPVSIIIGYDIKNSSQHAFDYLTHYSRITPHAFSSHSTPETIDILSGSGLPVSTAFTTFPIPVPSATGTPVAGQPTNSFNALVAAQRVMTLFNGTITAISYVVEGSLSSTQSETQIVVTFTPSNATAVLAWGGHIASRNDWGYVSGNPRSAGGISGSPFHMRLISWTYGSIGSQDRSLAGQTVNVPPAPLPVELVHFSAHSESGHAVIEWSTASEVNNDYFTIQRSSTLADFKPVATIDGHGNTSTISEYSWTDAAPLSSVSYYRLVQTDYDGKQTIYGPISFQNSKQSRQDFKVYSDASASALYVTYISASAADVQVEVMNVEGQKIIGKTFQATQGNNFVKVSVDNEPARGMYFVRIKQGDMTSQVQKVMLN